MTEALIEHGIPDTVLEVGTGCGYQTTILAQLVGKVFTVERIEGLLFKARERFHALKMGNINARHADGMSGWPECAPYGGILVAAAPAGVPDSLVRQLAVNARMIIPVGSGNEQQLLAIDRTSDGVEQRRLDWVTFVPMVQGIG